jgi:hypothetical protein
MPHRFSKRTVIDWLGDPIGMHRLHRNTFDDYTDYYDDEAKAFVSTIYRRDIDLFQYEFGPPNFLLSRILALV